MARKPKKNPQGKSRKQQPRDPVAEEQIEVLADHASKPKAEADGSGKSKTAKAVKRRVKTRLAKVWNGPPELVSPPVSAESEQLAPPGPTPGDTAVPEPTAKAKPTELVVSLRYVEAEDGRKLHVYGTVALNGTDIGQVSRLQLDAQEGKQLPKIELAIAKGMKPKDVAQAPDLQASLKQTVALLNQVPGIKVTSPLRRTK